LNIFVVVLTFAATLMSREMNLQTDRGFILSRTSLRKLS
jgi:hypothetical protein